MKRNLNLDLIKGLCILFILIDHFTGWTSATRLSALFPYWITMAVPLLMVVLGYLYAMSYQRHGINTLRKAYSFRQLRDRFIRYTIPFIMAYSIELIISSIDNGFFSIFPLWLKDFFTGGWGAGSYYYPILLQFMFFFPIIFFLILRYDLIGLGICLLMNIAYEIVHWLIQMPPSVYRLLLFRYTLLIAFGCYILIGKRKFKWAERIISLILGAFFIWLFNYTSYQPVILCNWTTTSFPTAFFVLPIALWLIQLFLPKNAFSSLIALLGRASYNIFLTQMVYFNYAAARIMKYIHLPNISLCLLNIIICCFMGCLFYYFEDKFTKRILAFIHKKESPVNA